jgi:hypothetical protein
MNGATGWYSPPCTFCYNPEHGRRECPLLTTAVEKDIGFAASNKYGETEAEN